MPFSSLNLPDYLLRSIEKAGYNEPTAVQTETIPLILSGKDLIVESQTGSGKTAAFALPILKILNDALAEKKTHSIHTLVLAPTRELCLQVSTFFNNYGRFMPELFKVITIIGGKDIEKQIISLRKGADIVVSTPGRLLDLLGRKEIILDNLKILVIDEADKILNLGFAEELENILRILPIKRQNLLLSATFPPKVMHLTEQIQKAAVHVKFREEAPTVENIFQRTILVDRDNRGLLIRHLVKTEDWNLVLVFVASKKAARNLAAKLNNNGIKAAEFHSDLSQDDRLQALNNFKSKKIPVLIATDIAARGLDINNITHVINFDLPRSPEDYIHRIGRTARAGKSGSAITFVTPEDRNHYALIEKRAGIKLELEQIAGFEVIESVVPIEKGQGGIKGKRKSKKDKLRDISKTKE